MNRALALALALPIVVAACLGRSQMTAERLRDAVVGYNDELRFGRSDLAVQRVDGPLRAQFVGSHYRWGRTLSIADSEIVNVEAIGESFHHAISFVNVTWHPIGTTILHETMVRQEWRKEGQTFVIIAESVIDGDPMLLAIPEGFRIETSALGESEDIDAGVDAGESDAGVPAAP